MFKDIFKRMVKGLRGKKAKRPKVQGQRLQVPGVRLQEPYNYELQISNYEKNQMLNIQY